MQRHVAFDRMDELRAFLVSRAPKHVYYSSAYYKHPDLQPMPRKVEGWLGADLIFDLDDEHLSDMEGKSRAERLESVKRIVKDQLLDDFLLKDFSFATENVRVVFSGGRGYHIHISDPKVLTLESPERREIVDYITGVGLDYEKIFTKEVIEILKFGPHSKPIESTKRLPEMSEPGWKGRLTTGIFKLLDEMEGLDKKECLELLKSEKYKDQNVGDSRAETIYEQLFNGEMGKRGIDTIRKERVVEILEPDKNRDIFLNLARKKASVKMAGETDEPVTVDTRRLIRMPGSLHGKSGLRVKPVPLDKLDEFEPLRDALAFDNQPIKIVVLEDIKFEIGENHYQLEQGEHTLPKYAAIFLMCSGKAEIG